MDEIKLNQLNHEIRKFDPTINGLNYNKRTYMVAGWISDLKPGDTLLPNKGYVDDDGFVHIFKVNPTKNDNIPWFTTELGDDAKLRFKFNPRKNPNVDKYFHVSRVGDLSFQHIVETTTEGDADYDAEINEVILRSTSKYVPEIKEKDDFLKKLIKQVIMVKDVNPKKYTPKVQKSYIISNYLNYLTKDTKVAPRVFASWMSLLDCNFQIIVSDNGDDKVQPLKGQVYYDSLTDSIVIRDPSEEEVILHPNIKQGNLRSAKQYN